MTLTEARSLLNKRVGRQYNRDAAGRLLLDHWLNSAARTVWEKYPLADNVTDTTTIPTVTDDAFDLPSTCFNIIDLKYSPTDEFWNEVDVPFKQDKRTIKMRISGITPTRFVYHTAYTAVTAGNSFPTYIWDNLIIEKAALLGVGEKKDPKELSVNLANMIERDWVNSFSIRKDFNNPTYHADGVRVYGQGNIYSAGVIEK